MISIDRSPKDGSGAGGKGSAKKIGRYHECSKKHCEGLSEAIDRHE